MRVIEYTKSRQHVKLTNFSTANSQAFLDQYESHKIFFFSFLSIPEINKILEIIFSDASHILALCHS